jgi:hypothetical protein
LRRGNRLEQGGVDVTKGPAQATVDKTKEIAGDREEDEGDRTTGEAITDGWIMTKVKTKFFDERLEPATSASRPMTTVVTVKGTVTSSAEGASGDDPRGTEV